MKSETMNNSDFIHLDVNTQYSLGQSVVRIDNLIDLCDEYNMPAVGVTDHNNLFSAYKVYKETQKRGIKLIIGSIVSVETKSQNDLKKLIFLCKSEEGYKNLCHLVTKSYIEGFKNDQPSINIDWLTSFYEGLIVISAYKDGLGHQTNSTKDKGIVNSDLEQLSELFGENFFLGIQRLGLTGEEEQINRIVSLSTKYDVPLVALNNPKFLSENDFISLEARACIDQGRVLEDQSRHRDYTDQQYFKTQEEMKELFRDLPEAVNNSIEIAKKCNFGFENVDHVLPAFDTPGNYSIDEYLTQQAVEGLSKLANKDGFNRSIYETRLNEELEIIKRTGFAGYFLIVADFVKWSREQNIPVGPGRGSGPGSLVAYCIGITDIDPIEHDLIFERFLNPERISMPDLILIFVLMEETQLSTMFLVSTEEIWFLKLSLTEHFLLKL